MSAATTLGARIKAQRETLGLSMRQIPGLDHATVSRIESGKLADPGLAVLKKLGAALGLTLEELDGAPASAVRQFPLRDLHPDPLNPRTIDPASPEDTALLESIRTIGLQQALSVRHIPIENKWMVVDGHRRLAALIALHGPKSKQAVPTLIVQGDENQTRLMQLVANMQRADMNPADVARAIKELVDGGQDTQAIGEALGRKRRWVQEQASVGRHLIDRGQKALRSGEISISQAVALAAERDEDRQHALIQRAIMEKLGEDYIRAVIAATKAQEDLAEAQRQATLPLPPDKDPAEVEYAKPNEHGVFEKPEIVARWDDNRGTRRGHLEISLVQFAASKWAYTYDEEWRLTGGSPGGASSMPLTRRYAEQSAALGFLAAAREGFHAIKSAAAGHPEDFPALEKCHKWVEEHLRRLQATDNMLAAWKSYAPARARAKAAPAEPPIGKKAKAPPPFTLKDAQKLPAWAKRMNMAYFVILGEGQATLVKGWKAMATAMHTAHGNDCVEMMERTSWANDTAGAPFDYVGQVYRVTDLKGRGPGR